MKKGYTELIVMLDRSGSMHGLERDTIGGYNNLLDRQKAREGEVLVSTILFDDRQEVLHNRMPLSEIQPLTDETYYVRGSTALLDAMGKSIEYIDRLHQRMRAAEQPEKTIFVMTTDGMENASRHYSYKQIQHLVKLQQELCHWEFLFLGANMDAIEVAGWFGIGADRAVTYCCDSEGTQLQYRVLAETIDRMRSSKKRLGGEWKAPIEADYQKRGRGRR